MKKFEMTSFSGVIIIIGCSSSIVVIQHCIEEIRLSVFHAVSVLIAVMGVDEATQQT